MTRRICSGKSIVQRHVTWIVGTFLMPCSVVLDTEDSPLYTLIDPCLKDPQEPGRARESITVLASVGQDLLNIVATHIKDMVNMRLAVR